MFYRFRIYGFKKVFRGITGPTYKFLFSILLRIERIFHISLKRMGFSSVPRLSGWSFQQRICGGVLPPPHCPDISGPAASPTDTLRKDSALTPVTSEKSTLFIGETKIVRFYKALNICVLYKNNQR